MPQALHYELCTPLFGEPDVKVARIDRTAQSEMD